MNTKWPLPDMDDNEMNRVNSLSQLDCGAFPKSYMDTCSCCPRDIFDKHDTDTLTNYKGITLKDVGCCKIHWTRKERYQNIKARVDRAIKRHKIFLIRGELPKLKEALEKRGWVQKYEATKTRTLPYGSVASLEARSLGDLTQHDGSLNEKAVIFALLRHKSPDFIWDCRNDFVDWHRGLSSNTILNRYQKPSIYTSKLGMARLLEEAHWLYEKDVSSVLFPRSYNLSREPKAFLDDFRLTAAAGLLKWFVQTMQNDQGAARNQAQRVIPMNRLEFAIKRCEEFIARENHENIDEEFDIELSEEEWNSFLDDYAAAVHDSAEFEITPERGEEQLQKYLEATNSALSRLKDVDPQYELNGMRNIWILKPSELCCGTGISISHNLRDIFRRVKSRPKDYFIVQKYIVIMDVPMNAVADTGGFSLVYKQNIPDFRPYLGPCLFLFGKSITLQEYPRKRDKKKKANCSTKQQQQQLQLQQQHRAWTAPPMIPRLREPKIVDFIDYLNTARCTAAN